MTMKAKALANPDRIYGGNLPGERRQQRRVKLIAAGYDIFGTVGFSNAKVDQVCAAAGVGIRSLYDEFSNLEGLFLAVYDDIMEAAYRDLHAVFEEAVNAPAKKRLDDFVRAYLHIMLGDTRSGRIVSIESARLDSFLGSHRNKTLNKFAKLLSGIPEPDPAAFDADTKTWSLMLAGGLNEIIIDAVLAKRKPNVDALATSVSEILVRTLLKSC